jgi:peptide/nickel transport system substrate-binding protein
MTMVQERPARWLAALLLAGAAALPATPALAQQKVLRATMHADVRTLDPIWTTQVIAGIHGMMVYDTLFATDFNLQTQPQMVEKWAVSADKKTYTFTLREGLRFSDGTPVGPKDAIASVRRWAARDGGGGTMLYTDAINGSTTAPSSGS